MLEERYLLLVTNQPSSQIRVMEREGQPMYKTLMVFPLGLLLKHNYNIFILLTSTFFNLHWHCVI